MTRRGAVLDPPPTEAEDVVARPRRRRFRWLFNVWTALVVAVAGGLLLLLVFPTRAWLNQRHQITAAQHRLDVLNTENQRLHDEATRLTTPEEVERLAREQFNLAKPNEQVFSVLPSPAAAPLPDTWPYGLLKQIVAARTAPTSAPATTAAPSSATSPPTTR
jgi:cell division protein FtsL